MKKTIKYRTALMAADCLFVSSAESMKIRNLEPSYAYSVWSSPVGTLSIGADIGARRVPLVSVDATSRRVGSRSKMI